MSDRHSPWTRRDFVRTGGGAAVALSLADPAWAQRGERAPKSATVILVRDQQVLDSEHRVNAERLRAMLADTVTRVTGKPTPHAAWASLFKPQDVVGLVPSRALNPTHDELVTAVKGALVDAGVPEANLRDVQNKGSKVAACTALLCMPALKAHWLTGIGTVLKNYIMFSDQPSRYHDADNDLLGEIWLLPDVVGKTRLVLVDALRPLCDKGPQPDPRYLWDYKGLIAGTDPVAVEAIGLEIITARRKALKGEPWPLSPPPMCVMWADRRYNLGTAKLEEITINRCGSMEGALV